MQNISICIAYNTRTSKVEVWGYVRIEVLRTVSGRKGKRSRNASHEYFDDTFGHTPGGAQGSGPPPPPPRNIASLPPLCLSPSSLFLSESPTLESFGGSVRVLHGGSKDADGVPDVRRAEDAASGDDDVRPRLCRGVDGGRTQTPVHLNVHFGIPLPRVAPSPPSASYTHFDATRVRHSSLENKVKWAQAILAACGSFHL